MWCWWLLFDVGAELLILVPSFWWWWLDTNISILSSTHFGSNIRRQYRCYLSDWLRSHQCQILFLELIDLIQNSLYFPGSSLCCSIRIFIWISKLFKYDEWLLCIFTSPKSQISGLFLSSCIIEPAARHQNLFNSI